jgi:hypothetical protein
MSVENERLSKSRMEMVKVRAPKLKGSKSSGEGAKT